MRKGCALWRSRSGAHQTYAYAPFPQGQPISMPQAMAVPRAGQRQRILWSSRPSRAAVTPRRSWRGFPAGRPNEQGEAIACAAARGMGTELKESLTSRRRGSMNCCERHVQDLVAPDREQSPQAGGRGGPRASSSSAAKMRDCEVPYIGDERCESLILCAHQTDWPPAATVRLPRATGWQTEDSRSIYPCGQN